MSDSTAGTASPAHPPILLAASEGTQVQGLECWPVHLQGGRAHFAAAVSQGRKSRFLAAVVVAWGSQVPALKEKPGLKTGDVQGSELAARR